MKKAKKIKRVILGVGYPWYKCEENGCFTSLVLYVEPLHSSIMCRVPGHTVELTPKGTGNWNKIRLIAEVIK